MKTVNSFASTAFKYSSWEFNKPMGNAMAVSPVLVLPEGLQKTLELPLIESLQPVDSNAENKEER